MEKPILEVFNLLVARSGKLVLKDISLTINEGEFVGIVGPNGSGKSTLMLAILGILKPSRGSIEIYGNPPLSRKLHRRIGWVSQAAANLPKGIRLTVRELVRLGTVNSGNMFDLRDNGRSVRVDNAIIKTGLEDVEDIDISRLSGGQRQRAVIARALATEADFILLDEPLVGIDRGNTILMVSHDLTAIRKTAHRMIFLEESIRFDGPTSSFPDLEKLADLRGIHDPHEDHQMHVEN